MNRSQAIIEFKPDGTIISANENFCRTLGYQLSEIVGKHHRIFLRPEDASSKAYQELWEGLPRVGSTAASISGSGRMEARSGSKHPIIQ